VAIWICSNCNEENKYKRVVNIRTCKKISDAKPKCEYGKDSDFKEKE